MKFKLKYPDFLKLDKSSQQRFFYVGISLALFLFRIIGDIILFYIDNKITNINYLWNSVTSAALIWIIILITFHPLKNFYLSKNLQKEDDEFFNDLYKSIILLVLNLFSILFLGLLSSNESDSIFIIILKDFIAIFIFTSVLYLSNIFKDWILIRRISRTNSLLKRELILLLIVLAITLSKHWIEEDIRIVANIALVILVSAIGLFFWQINSRNDWIYNLTKKTKIRLFWLSGSLSVLFFVILILLLDKNSNFSMYLRGFSELLLFSTLLLSYLNFIFIIRVWFVSISSLPNADIVERKSSELSSLAYLNQFVTESVEKDIDYLLSTVTNLAVKSSRATGGWCEIYNGNEISVIANINFQESEIIYLNEHDNISNYFKSIEDAKLIQSINDERNFAPLDLYSKKARAILIIPISSSNISVGTIVLTNIYDFGFDANDLMMMKAFSANLKIALENAKLMKDSIEKEKYKNELILARNIQQKLLPQKLPNYSYFSISAFSMPATEVGGDYYDAVTLKNGNPCIIIGDVSGKGISAAFYMAQLKGVVLAHAPNSLSSKELLSKVNHSLFGNMERQMYITMSAVSIDSDNDEIDFCRAGHMPLFIKSSNQIKEIIPKGIGIGLASSIKFDKLTESATISIAYGDALLLFTDGLNELKISSGEEFGYEPLKAALSSNSVNSNEIIELIKNEILDKKGHLTSHDDMTLISIIYNK